MRAAIYVRVSTEDQHLEQQLDECRLHLAAKRWDEAGVYEDTESGAKITRAGYKRLLHDAALNRFDVVVVWALDRFGRSLLELLSSLEVLKRYGVAFASVREAAVDTTSPAGELMLQLLGAFAQFERARLRERTLVGLEGARRRGSKLGRPRKAPDRAAVEQLLATGKSKETVAKALGVSRRTISRLLAEPQAGEKGRARG